MRTALALALVLTPLPASGAGLLEMPAEGGIYLHQASDISGDGQTLVGSCESGSQAAPCRWSQVGGFVFLEPLGTPAMVAATSYDGSVSVGWRADPGPPFRYRAVRWGPAGAELLAESPGALHSEATAVSADGAVVTGQMSPGEGFWPFRWTEAGGMELSPQQGYALGLSADGRSIAGFAEPPGAFLWHETEGWTSLPGIQPGDAGFAASADGRVVVGGAPFWWLSLAWRWTAEDGMVALPPLPAELPGVWVAFDTSADGSVVVGHDWEWGASFVWDAAAGTRTLLAALAAYGVDVSDWERIDWVRAVSDDGRRIPGIGRKWDGTGAVVVAVLAPACDDGLDNDGDDRIDLADAGCRNAGSNSERSARRCGLGFEIAAVVPLLAALRRRRRR